MRPFLAALAFSAFSSVALADTFEVDTSHSTVLFRAKHFNASYTYGRFNDVTGKVLWEADPTKSVFDITVKAASVDSNSDKRDQHLASPDFLNAAQFPVITFKSKSVTKKSGNVYSVTGDLTFHGVTKTITTDVEHVGTGPDAWGGTRAGFETTITIKRSEYGVKNMLDAVGDDIRLTIAVEGVKK